VIVLDNGIELTWLGHSAFRIKTPKGREILIDPFLEGNPSCPESWKRPQRVDLILVTHGHGDHLGDCVSLAKTHDAVVVGIYDLTSYLERQGVRRTVGMNKGGTASVGDVQVTMVHALHSSSGPDGRYLGDPAGFVLRFDNDYVIYHAGDTAVFGDMRLIGELYRPELALLPIGDHFTMGPKEAARACELIGCRRVVPMHYGTFPVLSGTPAKLRERTQHLPDFEVVELRPGESLR
jgi:L-ascorbate metabolism protein UlaG (beta-lactamase superfamily)